MLVHIYYLFLPILLFITAIFASSEAALFSLSRPQLESIRAWRPWLYRQINELIKKPESLLSTLVIGNEFFNILITTLVVALLDLHFKHLGDHVIAILSVLVSATLLLVFSEVMPKTIAFRFPVIFSSFLVFPISWVHKLLTPFRVVFLGISIQLLKWARINIETNQPLTEQDFLTLVEVGADSGSLEHEEKEMIYNVFQLSDQPVSSIMTPWNNVFTLSKEASIEDILNKVREKTFSRIPLLSKTDHVAGILYTKELLKLLIKPNHLESENNQTSIIQEAVYPPYIISIHKKISKLFREFKHKKVHIALVVDEYGRPLGVVTLEDILNSLFQVRKKSGAPNS